MTKARDTANLTGSGVGLSLLDIDAGTDIGAALVDADLMIVDDGAGGTNRKATMSRLATYMGTKIGGSMVYLASSGAISNAANVSFTQFDATKYDHYAFYFQHVIPATDDVRLFGYHSTDGGSSYDTTNGEYHNYGTTDLPGFQINYTATELGSDTNEYGVSGFAYLYAPHVAAYTVMYAGGCASVASNGGIYGHVSPSRAMTQRLAAENTDAIRFAMDSGNIESGEIVMYGIANGT